MIQLGAQVNEIPSSPEGSQKNPLFDNLNKLREAIVVVDQDNNITAYNHSAADFFNIPPDQNIEGENISCLLPKAFDSRKLLEVGSTHEIKAHQYRSKEVFDALINIGQLPGNQLMVTFAYKPMTISKIGKFSSSYF